LAPNRLVAVPPPNSGVLAAGVEVLEGFAPNRLGVPANSWY